MKTGNVIRGIAAAAIMAGSSLALAETPNYNFIEAGYGIIDLDGWDLSGDSGYWAGFSAQMGEPFYLSGSFQQYDLDRYRSSVDLDISELIVGYRAPISDSSDFNLELGYDRLDSGPIDGDGWRASLGVRSMWANATQGRLYAGYTTDSDFNEGDYFVGAEGTYVFAERFGLTLQVESYEFDLNLIRAGFRLMF